MSTQVKKYVCILRGINVSGKNKIKMDELKQLCTALGFVEVQTYIQSGNIVFSYSDIPVSSIEELIHAKILEVFGYNVPTIVRTAEEWLAAVCDNPYLHYNPKPIDKLYLTILKNEPEGVLVEKLKAVDAGDDEFQLKGKNLFIHCPGQYGKTKLSNTFLEKKLKQVATTRNWKTVTKITEILAK